MVKKQVPWHWVFYMLVVCIAWPLLWSAPLVDEPVMVYTGWQVAQGKLLYRDVFEFVMPGTALLIAGTIKLLGGGLPIQLWLVLRGLNLLLWLVSMQVMEGFMETLALKPQWRWLYRLSMTNWLFASPMLLLQITHHLYSAHFAVWGVGCMGRYVGSSHKVDSGRPWVWLILSGLCFGLSSCFTQTLGVLVGGSVFLFLLWKLKIRKELPVYVLACVLPVFLVGLYFVFIGEWPVFIDSVLGFLLHSGYKELDSFPYQPLFFNVSTLLPNMCDVLASTVWFLKPVILAVLSCVLMQITLLVVGGLYAVWSLLRTGREEVQYQNLLALAALGFFVASLSSPSTYLFGFHSWFLVLLGLFGLARYVNKVEGFSACWLQNVLGSVLSLLFIVYILQLGTCLLNAQGEKERVVFSHGQSLPLIVEGNLQQALNKNRVTQWIFAENTPKNEPVSLFVFNSSPEFYLTLEAENPTKYRYLMPVLDPPRKQYTALRELQQKPPQWMIWDRASVLAKENDPRYRNIPRERLNLIPEFRQWVLGHYKRVFEAYPYVVYERR
ncbi:MAG: hypothetical protein K2X01_06120 [Cyanobacteria bacterium]|nr:hypothetical protein [Cyanobacteriota bacterium]